MEALKTPSPGTAAAAGVGSVRWTICALLFLATTINYIDRQAIGILKPDLQKATGWSEMEYWKVVFAFAFAYAVSLLVRGGVIDRLGPRRGFTFSVVWWSVAAMAHALAHSVFGFGAARFALGLGEGGN